MIKRKVLILPSWYPTEVSNVGGIFIQDQVQEIAKKYDTVVLFLQEILYQDMLRRRLVPKSQIEQRNGVTVYSERVPVLLPSPFKLAYDSYCRVARRRFEKLLHVWGKPDLIHGHVVLPGGWVAVNLGRQYSVPVVLTEHSGPFSMHLQSKYQRRLVRETLTRANRVIAVSPALAREILAFDNTVGVEVVGNIIRTEFFLPLEKRAEDSKPPKLRFLTVALLSKDKGIHYLIEAMNLLTHHGVTSSELFIGGDGPERSKLEEQIRSLDLSNRCFLLGLLSRSQVRDWMQQCDVFVLPSLHETFGIVVGEAMACGKPVIATRCGGPEFILTPETGLLVDVANPVALAKAMDEVISGRITFDPAVIRQSVDKRFGAQAFLCNISATYEQLWTEQRRV